MSDDTTDPGNRSSAEIEREVEQTRDSLRDTLEALRERASPGQLFEQVLDYAKESGGPEMMRNLGRAVRDNLLPLLLIGAGVGWLVMSGNGPRRQWEYGEHGDDRDYGRRWASDTSGRRRAGEMRDRGGESAVGRATSAIGETASHLRDRVSGAAGDIVEGAREAADQVGEMASDAYRRVTRAAGSVAEGARDYAMDAPHQAGRWMLHEQPLLLGALGLALGAAMGAMLPGTEAEDRWMGETREDVLRRARETAEEGYERAKGSAQGLVGDVSAMAEEHGGGVAGTVRGMAHTARDSVAEAARDLADQAKSALGEPGKPANEPGAPASAAMRPHTDPAR